jgi:D-glycero-D-manno-heptose 1,7-bisphosphate phosphatase
LKPPVFLDRDGTLIVDRHYLSDPEGVELLPGAAEAVARYRAVHGRLVELLAAAGAWLDGEYHAPHTPGDPDPEALRKPGAGMFLRAASEHGVELAGAFFIGDRVRDVAPAERFGGRAILVRSPESEAEMPPYAEVAGSLAEAVERIVALDRG